METFTDLVVWQEARKLVLRARAGGRGDQVLVLEFWTQLNFEARQVQKEAVNRGECGNKIRDKG